MNQTVCSLDEVRLVGLRVCNEVEEKIWPLTNRAKISVGHNRTPGEVDGPAGNLNHF